jgi:hypothetical protein
VRNKAFELQITSDIRQLDTMVQQFHVEWKVDHLPSRIVLRNDGAYNMANPLEKDSAIFLKKMWPRLQFPVYTANVVPATDPRYSLGWFPDDAAATPTSAYVLSGEQCLVFFLGGIQQGGACRGFSANASNPTIYNAATASGSRKQLFDFPSARLAPGVGGPLVYLDAMGTAPIAYFSSYAVDNGYMRYGSSDCFNIPAGYPAVAPLGIAPYYDPTTNVYYHKNGYQIISAGVDKTFGAGGGWDAKSGMPYALGGNVGFDDIANFHDRVLGAGAQ